MSTMTKVSQASISDSVRRAIESAEWANQHDDVAALTELESFLESRTVQSMLYAHLHIPHGTRPTYEDNAILNLDVGQLARLYSQAHDGNNAGRITCGKYLGKTIRGSYIYKLNHSSSQPLTLFIRRCLGELRGELNEDHFTIYPRPVAVTPSEPKGGLSFWKKVWKNL